LGRTRFDTSPQELVRAARKWHAGAFAHAGDNDGWQEEMAAKISAFADEIGPDLQLQIDTLKQAGIRYVELRGAWDTNVMKLSDAQAARIKQMLGDNGIGVACIGSPIGKVRIDEDWQQHFDQFKHAVDLAEFFGCGYVRIFSFYPPEGGRIEEHRDEVLRRLRQQAEFVAMRPVMLALENESRIYGDTSERCGDLMKELAGLKVTMAFDPANFVSIDEMPVYEKCWLPLKQYVGYFHMKDMMRQPEKKIVPVGQGEGNCDRILKEAADSGYNGFLALEPHLAKAGKFSGFTGPELFLTAAKALKDTCEQVGLPVE
jgi:sugar phosphate isomerase/epimerase